VLRSNWLDCPLTDPEADLGHGLCERPFLADSRRSAARTTAFVSPLRTRAGCSWSKSSSRRATNRTMASIWTSVSPEAIAQRHRSSLWPFHPPHPVARKNLRRRSNPGYPATCWVASRPCESCLVFRMLGDAPAAGRAEPEDTPTTTTSTRSLVLGVQEFPASSLIHRLNSLFRRVGNWPENSNQFSSLQGARGPKKA
jgi:hypothetical protein